MDAAETSLGYLKSFAPHVHGLVYYRAGRWAEAIAKVRESEHNKPAWPAQPMNWCVQAMASFRIGKTAEARTLLARVEASVARLRTLLHNPGDLRQALESNASVEPLAASDPVSGNGSRSNCSIQKPRSSSRARRRRLSPRTASSEGSFTRGWAMRRGPRPNYDAPSRKRRMPRRSG